MPPHCVISFHNINDASSVVNFICCRVTHLASPSMMPRKHALSRGRTDDAQRLLRIDEEAPLKDQKIALLGLSYPYRFLGSRKENSKQPALHYLRIPTLDQSLDKPYVASGGSQNCNIASLIPRDPVKTEKPRPKPGLFCNKGSVYNRTLIGEIIRLLLGWCRRGDLNPHGGYPPPPQDGVSTNSTTSALNSWIKVKV
jgi:hypothetical protein